MLNISDITTGEQIIVYIDSFTKANDRYKFRKNVSKFTKYQLVR